MQGNCRDIHCQCRNYTSDEVSQLALEPNDDDDDEEEEEEEEDEDDDDRHVVDHDLDDDDKVQSNQRHNFLGHIRRPFYSKGSKAIPAESQK